MSYPENNRPVKKDKDKNDAMKKAGEAVREFRMSNKSDPYENGGGNIQSDVLGSYTGMSYDGGAPEQDADDL